MQSVSNEAYSKGTLHLNIDDDLYAKAEDIAQSIGLDLETCIRLFLVQMVREQALPFTLKADLIQKQEKYNANLKKTSTEDIRRYIRGKLTNAQQNGDKELILVSGKIHKELELDNQMPAVCNAMYSVKGFTGETLHKTPSGKSSTIKIKYLL